MVALRAEMVEDRGGYEVWEVWEAVGDPGAAVARFELAKPAGPAVMYARRMAGGCLEIGWRPRTPDRTTRILPDTAAVLRAAGLRGQIHPNDAVAVAYPDREAFDESARAEPGNHGNQVHGPYETADGLTGIIDLRRQLEAGGVPPTDPADPDDTDPSPRPRVLRPTGDVLRAAGLRDQIHPNDAVAFNYRTRFYFDAWTRIDQASNGNAAFGPYDMDGQVVGITDLRPQLAAAGAPATDPASPDDMPPPRAEPPCDREVRTSPVLYPVR